MRLSRVLSVESMLPVVERCYGRQLTLQEGSSMFASHASAPQFSVLDLNLSHAQLSWKA